MNRLTRFLRLTCLALLLAPSVSRGQGDTGGKRLVITYVDGRTQSVNLDRTSDHILRMEFLDRSAPTTTTTQPPNTGSNDFGTTVRSDAAFKGDVLFIPDAVVQRGIGQTRLDEMPGLQPMATLYTPTLNISPRRFEQGFPGIPGRTEWFAVRYTGSFYVSQAGAYAFRTVSDDGSSLMVDGRMVIDDWGLHGVQSKNGSVTLSSGVHSIRVDYFQGPRFDIALQLFVAMPGQSEKIFDIREFQRGR